MSRFTRRPSRTQSRRLASSLTLFFVAVLALLLVCPVAVKAEEDAKAKYGPVIGIGMYLYLQVLVARATI